MMKTYNFIYAAMALCVMGCSKSDDNSDDDAGRTKQNVAADYNLLLRADGNITGTLLNGDADRLSVNEGASDFEAVEEPLLVSEDNNVLTMYRKNSNCSGTVNIHDFKNGSSQTYDLFSDLGSCNLTPKAIVNSGSKLYVAYEKEISADILEFAIRAVDISSANATFEDMAISYIPVGLAFSNNRLFVLGLDADITGENKLNVFDANTLAEVFTGNVGFDARSIFKNPDGNIIIGFDELHTTVDQKTLAFTYTNYAAGFAPNFTTSELRNFDSTGKMYYAMQSGELSSFTQIPAVYDFEANSSVVYAFENFLTEAQLKFEFEIENTTLVNYDEANNLLLVGYKKTGSENKGGLLRINPVPQPKFEGNLDLDGIPYAIYMN